MNVAKVDLLLWSAEVAGEPFDGSLEEAIAYAMDMETATHVQAEAGDGYVCWYNGVYDDAGVPLYPSETVTIRGEATPVLKHIAQEMRILLRKQEEKSNIWMSHYVHGSDGHRNLFLRKQGDVYEIKGLGSFIAEVTQWIIQWGGSRRYDSGYYAEYFPGTPEGKRAAYLAMCEYQERDSQ